MNVENDMKRGGRTETGKVGRARGEGIGKERGTRVGRRLGFNPIPWKENRQEGCGIPKGRSLSKPLLGGGRRVALCCWASRSS